MRGLEFHKKTDPIPGRFRVIEKSTGSVSTGCEFTIPYILMVKLAQFGRCMVQKLFC